MANDITGTYQQAKDVFNTLALHEVATITTTDKAIFRKHLVEMQKRKQSNKRFATRNNGNNSVKITRIE
jgi:predicted nucleic acid-binding protein